MVGIRSKKGQSAAFDAFVFLSILLVASALILGISTHLKRFEEVSEFDYLSKLTERVSNALLHSTVPNASYADMHGSEVVIKDISVLDMVVEELLLMHTGVPGSNFNGTGRYNERIVQTLSSLVDGDMYGFELTGTFMESSLSIGRARNRTETAAVVTEIHLPDVEDPIRITLSIWP